MIRATVDYTEDAEMDEGSDYGSEYDSEEDEDEKDMHKSKPLESTSKAAAKYLTGKKQIAILTGAGVSMASGIQPFTGVDGIMRQQERKYKDHNDCREVLTRDRFLKEPEKVWDWTYNFLQSVSEVKPNITHRAIREFQEHCEQTKGG